MIHTSPPPPFFKICCKRPTWQGCPNRIISVLFLFNLRTLQSIQFFRSFKQFSSGCSDSLLPRLAYMLTFCILKVDPRGNRYNENKMWPKTDPWGTPQESGEILFNNWEYSDGVVNFQVLGNHWKPLPCVLCVSVIAPELFEVISPLSTVHCCLYCGRHFC